MLYYSEEDGVVKYLFGTKLVLSGVVVAFCVIWMVWNPDLIAIPNSFRRISLRSSLGRSSGLTPKRVSFRQDEEILNSELVRRDAVTTRPVSILK